MTKTRTVHPFGALLAQFRARRPGLTQRHLAELAGYDQAILVRMGQGKKDLTGPSGRERVVRLIGTLAEQSALTTLEEANALLLSADLPPLFDRQPNEARLIERLSRLQPGQRVRRTNLPAPRTSFIGRAQEIDDMRHALAGTRLLTLTGAGGAGKTRLAQRIAADVLLLYSEGVWYAELAALADPDLIAETVARALGLRTDGRVAYDAVADYLRERHVLLVLDNCEHLIYAVAAFASALLGACPRVTILATSREALNLEGEALWRVPPMRPDEASQLFIERATAAMRATPLDPRDTTIDHICRRLDGMPLAIELAAARLQALSLGDIAARLDDRFTLLANGRRDALPRHQTLRALIDWSYESLTGPEKIVFRRLGVFVGGWAIEEAAHVAGYAPSGDGDILSLMTQLASKSLVVVDVIDTRSRYRFLETIREYALEKLVEHNELEATRRAHAEAYAQFAERSEMPVRGPQQQEWIARLVRDQANLTTALHWSFGIGGEAFSGCRIVSVLKIAWISSSLAMNALHWIRCANDALTDQMPARMRAALLGLRVEYDYSHSYQESVERWTQALRLYEDANDPIGIADATFNIGSLLLEIDEYSERGWTLLRQSIRLADAAGDTIVGNCARMAYANWVRIQKRFDEADTLYREGIQRSRDRNDLANLIRLLWCFGASHLEQLRFREALPYFEESAQLAQELNSPPDEIMARSQISEAIRYSGDVDRAVAINEEVLAFARDRPDPLQLHLPILVLAKSLNDVGQPARAITLLRELIHILINRDIRNPDWYPHVFDALACSFSAQADFERAIQTWGASSGILKLLKHRRLLHLDWEYAPYIAKARDALGEAGYQAAYAEGHAMPLDQAIACALA